MKYITIHSDGAVTGDIGAIVGYAGQEYSDTIKFYYPAIGDEYIKYVVYTWGTTRMERMVEADDTVKLMLLGAGIIEAQFYAKEPVTGKIGLMSKPFQLIVHASIDFGPDTASNCYRKGCYPPPPHPIPPECNSVEMMVKFGIELERESEVRAAQDSAIWEELVKIKDAMSAAGINTYEPIATVEDCNLLVKRGEFNLKEQSLNTPEGAEASTSPWIVDVKVFSYQVVQTAYSADDGDTKVFYRTGTIVPDNNTVWQGWVPMIHETKVQEYL